MSNNTKRRGAVSIFIVVFTALLITVVTASFIQIMVSNQEQASNNDLAQSAYDSALAGVEDAKRALIRLRNCELSGPSGCANSIKSKMNDSCTDALSDAGIAFTGADQNEQQVGSGLNQAYTCVKIQLNTDDIDGTVTPTAPDVIPLDSGDEPFTRIRLSWFTAEDLPKDVNGQANACSIQ